MKKTLFALALALALAANGQKIDTEKSDRSKVIRVQTLMNHLSIIELAEPVTEVAAGSSSYKVEWRGNKVFVQPLEPEATTNLFIWTASGRLNYELVAVSAAGDAEFAIDQEPGKAATPPPPPPPPAVDPIAVEKEKLASQMLLAGSPVRLSGELKPLHNSAAMVRKAEARSDPVADGPGGHDRVERLEPGRVFRSKRRAVATVDAHRNAVIGRLKAAAFWAALAGADLLAIQLSRK